MKQIEIAQKLGVTPATVNHVLHGNRRAGWDVAKKFAKLTGTDPALWIEGTPSARKKAIRKLRDKAA